jgi:hypothetical protein
MTGCAPTLALTAAGAQVSAVDPAPAGDLAPGQTVTRRFRVTGTASGTAQLTATATAAAYGSALTTTAAGAVTVDLDGPVASITAPSSPSVPGPLPVRWSASDPSGITAFAVEVSTDGGAWTPWTSGVLTGGDYATQAGRTYRFRVHAADAHGTLGDWAVSPAVTVTKPLDPLPGGDDGNHGTPLPPPPPADAHVRLTSVRVGHDRRNVAVRARAAVALTGRMTFTLQARVGRRTYRATASSRVKRGALTATLRLKTSRWRTARLTGRYAGNTNWKAATVVRTVRAPHRG